MNPCPPTQNAPTFEEGLVALYPRLLRAALYLCGDPADAHDLVQDAIERGLRCRDRFRSGDSPEPWMTTILRRLFIDRYRAQRARARHFPGGAPEPAVPAEPPPSRPWERFTTEDIHHAAHLLAPLYREVFTLFTFDKLSQRQIARRLSLSASTVATRLVRARHKLRALLESGCHQDPARRPPQLAEVATLDSRPSGAMRRKNGSACLVVASAATTGRACAPFMSCRPRTADGRRPPTTCTQERIMWNQDGPCDLLHLPLPRYPGTTRRRIARVTALTGLMVLMGCDSAPGDDEAVTGASLDLKNTGRTPEQAACDSKLQDCYVDCSVRYPDAPNTLNEELRQGCLDSCDASHNLCTSTRAATTAAANLAAGSASTVEATPSSPVISPTTAAAVSQAKAVKSCTATIEGGLWCCIPISTPPYVSCTYTPPPDILTAFTALSQRAQ